MWKICLLRAVFATVPPAVLCAKMKLCFPDKVNVKSHKAACLPFEAKQDSFLGQPGLVAKQSCAAWALRKTKNPLPRQAVHLLSDIKVCMKIGIPGICSGLREKVQLYRRTVLGSQPSVTSLGGVLLGRQPQNPFWSHVPLQPPHQIPTPPVKQFPSTLARLSDAALLVLASNATPWGLRWLQDYHSSHTQAANLHPHLGKEVSQDTSLLPSLQCSFCRASSRVTLPRYCTKSSKQDLKMGIVSFKLQTWELRLREQRISGHHCKDSQDSSLDLSYSKEHAFPSNTMSRISPAIKPFMDQPSTLVLERSMAWPYLISLTLLQLFPFTNILKSHTSPGFLCSSGRNILATRSSALHI